MAEVPRGEGSMGETQKVKWDYMAQSLYPLTTFFTTSMCR